MASKEVSVLFKAVDSVTAPLRDMNTRVQGFVSGVSSMWRGLASAFAGFQIFQGLKESIEEGLKAERAWARVAQAVKNSGGDFRALRPALDDAVDRVTKLSTATDDDLREALTRLITLTGNTSGSMKNLSLVADVAALKHIGVADAADIVGKAMAGNTKVLKEFGIEGGTTAERMDSLRQTVAGFAATEAASLGGRLENMNRAWGEFKEEIGSALLGTDNLGEGVLKLTDKLDALRQGVEDNKGVIRDFSKIAVDVGGVVGGVVGGLLGSLGRLFTGFIQGWEALFVSVVAGADQLAIRVKLGWAKLTGNEGMTKALTDELAASKEAWRNAVAEIGGIADAGETVIDTGMRSHAEERSRLTKNQFDALTAVTNDGYSKLTASQKQALGQLVAAQKSNHLVELHLTKEQRDALDEFRKESEASAARSKAKLGQIEKEAAEAALTIAKNMAEGYNAVLGKLWREAEQLRGADAESAKAAILKVRDAFVKHWLQEAVPAVKKTTESVGTLRLSLTDTSSSIDEIEGALDRYTEAATGMTRADIAAWQAKANLQARITDVAAAIVAGVHAAQDVAHNLASVFGEEVVGAVDLVAGSVNTMADGLQDVMSGNWIGGITKGVGAAVSLVKGLFGKSEAEKKLEEALGKNSTRLVELRGKIGDLLNLNVTGRQLAGAQTALQEFFKSGGASGKGWGDRLGSLLLGQGLTMKDVDELASTLQINIRPNGHLDPQALKQLMQALGAVEPTTFAQTFAGQRERISQGVGIGALTDELGEAVKLIADPKLGAPAIAAALKGLDLSSTSGKASAVTALKDLFTNIDQVGAAGLGGLTGSEFLGTLEWLIGLLGAVDQAAADSGLDATPGSGVASTASTGPVVGGAVPAVLVSFGDGREWSALDSIAKSVQSLMTGPRSASTEADVIRARALANVERERADLVPQSLIGNIEQLIVQAAPGDDARELAAKIIEQTRREWAEDLRYYRRASGSGALS